MMKRLMIVLFIMLLLLCGCGKAESAITEMNLIDDKGVILDADSDGIIYTESCTVEVFFSGDVNTISFYAVTETETNRNAVLLGTASVSGHERALYNWELPANFTGYVWAVLNGDTTTWKEGSYIAVSGDAYLDHALFTCEHEGKHYELMLFMPVDKNGSGIWAVETYRDETGEYEPEFKPTDVIPNREYLYEMMQQHSNLQGGNPDLLIPENVALNFMNEQYGFTPEVYEIRMQRDNNY